MASGRLYKIVNGLTSVEVHGRRPTSEDDQPSYHHLASYRTREDAQADIKRRKGYKDLHDRLDRKSKD